MTSNNKVGLHQSCNCPLIEFLCTDLDGNLSFALNPHCVPKLNEYFLSLFKGLSGARYRENIFEQSMKNEELKGKFMDHKVDTAILATMIPLFIFTMLLGASFLGTLAVDLVPCLLFTFLPLLEVFLLDCA
jgi:hypothetical protein